MKKLILSAAIVLSSISTFAQASSNAKAEVTSPEAKTEAVVVEAKSETVTTKVVATKEGFVAINATEVPAPVHAALEVAHPGAVVEKAYINEAKEYKLEVKVADQNATLYADAEGNWIKK